MHPDLAQQRVELVTVASVANRTEFAIARGMLLAHGIEAHLSSDDAGGVEPNLGFVRGYGVRVHPDDVVEAQELLAEVGATLLAVDDAKA